MNICEPFIRRPVMTTLLMLALLVAGILSFSRLPVSNLPEIEYPVLTVTASLPGAAPETMANTVTTPLENQFSSIPGLVSMSSSSLLGSTTIVLQFDIKKSLDSAATDTTIAITRALSQLPPNMPTIPTFRKTNPSDTPIFNLAITSDVVSLGELYTLANSFVGQRISTIQGVAQVQVQGSPYAVRVQADPNILSNLGITLQDVSDAIQTGNPSLPTGLLYGPSQSFTIISKNQLGTAASYEPLVVTYINGAPVRIKDIGRTLDSTQNDKLFRIYFDKDGPTNAVALSIFREPGANTIEVADAIHRAVPDIARQLPGSVDLKILIDRSGAIRDSVAEVEFTLLIAAVLVVLVIFIYLGKFADTIIPSISIPLSLVGTFLVMYFANFSIDNLSLLALMLAIGFVIDDSIVVIENIVRHIEEGKTPWEAALKGSEEIGFTILSMTLSLASVFIPLVFMGGILGRIFREFAITLTAATLMSGFIAIVLTPMLCSRFLAVRGGGEGFFEKLANNINQTMLGWYRPALRTVMQYKKTMMTIGTLTIFLSGLLFYVIPKDFLPQDDVSIILGVTRADEGTSPEQMARYQTALNAIVEKETSIKAFFSITGISRPREGILFMSLNPPSDRKPVDAIIQSLSRQLAEVPGIEVFLRNIPLINLTVGPATRANYTYVLQSVDPVALYTAATALTEKMRDLPGFQSVSNDLDLKNPQLKIEVLRDQASALGITAAQIENALLLAYSGNRVTKIQNPLEQNDVILELLPEFQRNADSLSAIYVRSKSNGQMIPLSAVTTWKESIGVASVNHLNQFPSVTIYFNIAPNIPLGTAIEALDQAAAASLPAEVTGSNQGTAQTFQESVRSMGVLLVLALLVIYIVLGILYESFIHPLTILSTLPPATFGGLLTLYILGIPLSIYAYLGLILLLGIVKKNGIMVVDFALENIRSRGDTPEEAAYNASITRFRPIMMTTVAAIMGAVPIVLGTGTGADARRPLGYVIIGGLLFSQLVTLFLTPIVYSYMERFAKTPKNV